MRMRRGLRLGVSMVPVRRWYEIMLASRTMNKPSGSTEPRLSEGGIPPPTSRVPARLVRKNGAVVAFGPLPPTLRPRRGKITVPPLAPCPCPSGAKSVPIAGRLHEHPVKLRLAAADPLDWETAVILEAMSES